MMRVFALLAMLASCTPRTPTAALPVPDGCRERPSLPISLRLDYDMGDYYSSYDEAMAAWNDSLRREAFRWAHDGEAADVVVVQGGWRADRPYHLVEVEARCINGHYHAFARHNQVLDASEAYFLGMHMLGHVLGLAHSTSQISVMNPKLSASIIGRDEGMPRYWILDSDIATVRVLYPE
jgi:hypothetical protein